MTLSAGNDGEHVGDDTVTALVTPSFPSHMGFAVGTMSSLVGQTLVTETW